MSLKISHLKKIFFDETIIVINLCQSQKVILVLNIVSHVRNYFPWKMDPCACPFNLNCDVFYIQIIISVSSDFLAIFVVVAIFVIGSMGVWSQEFLESSQGSGGFSLENVHIYNHAKSYL